MHYKALVELRGITTDPGEVEQALEEAMRPYYSDCPSPLNARQQAEWAEDNEEGPRPLCTQHKGHEWDWYVIGGRYTDFFQSVPEPQQVPWQGEDAARASNRISRQIFGSTMVEEEPERDGYDVIRKGDVDWEAMIARQMQRAAGWWDEYQQKQADKPDGVNRYLYGVEDGDTDRDAYIVRRTKDRTYTILTADGRWLEKETFVYLPDGKSFFRKVEDWDRVWDETVGAMPADSVLVIVDFHN